MTQLYDLSVGTYKRVLASTIAVMEKGASFFDEQGRDSKDILEMRLISDMAAFPFQVNSVRHHSLGALKGILAGEFSPPPELPEANYQGLVDLLGDALAELDEITVDAVTAIEGKAIYFKARDYEIPFTTENFVLSFSLPNLYFHATTIYDMLRIQGVPLRKMDFLGKMSTGLPE